MSTAGRRFFDTIFVKKCRFFDTKNSNSAEFSTIKCILKTYPNIEAECLSMGAGLNFRRLG